MKRQIDPNLDNLIDENILADMGKADSTLTASTKKQIDPELTLDTGDEILTSQDVPTNTKPEEEVKLNIETVDKKPTHHHHHHHHHHSSSDSTHSHSGSHHIHSSSHHSHSGSHHHSSSKKKKEKKLPVAAKIAIAVLMVVLILALTVAGTFLYLQQSGKSNLTTVPANADYEETIEYNGDTYTYNKDVVAFAFIGVDKRELGLEDGAIGTAGQADTDIVITINTQTGRAKAIAVPRDTMVDVDLYSTNGIFLRTENMQLCLSYAYGNGTDTSATNVTTALSRILYNVPIQKYFALDLDGIAPLNDAIGGVTVTSLYDFKSLGIRQGDEVKLIGDMTETYVRTRDIDTVNASLNRTARQVQYIKAFAAQLVPAVMQDFSIVNRLYNTASKYSTTNISLSNATYLASFLLSRGVTDFETVTLEGEMRASDKEDYGDYVYAEFYPDKDKLMEVILDTFYTKTNK